MADSCATLSALIVGAGLFIFGGPLTGSAYAQGIAAQSAPTSQLEQNRLDELGDHSLEIRGAGVAVGEWYQTALWGLIKKKNDNSSSIFSQRPEDYPSDLDSRQNVADFAVRGAFKHSAGHAVAYWPVPAFALGPPKRPELIGATSLILDGRNAATLGVTLFVAEHSSNTAHAQETIERLYSFMEANSTVPEVLIVSEDGDVVRDGRGPQGRPRLPQFGSSVPVIYESVAGLLLARSDRVDQYLRPFAVQEKENNQDKSTDLGKLWAFYWQKAKGYGEYYAAHEREQQIRPYLEPGTMSRAYWQSQLPELMKQVTNRGPGELPAFSVVTCSMG
ncbi:type VI lipase adapter Tla3 domain-containing protein [Pseudomonas sp. KNUC1026]|uniref:type VI lipase adapter Tla3 domain-containing protein n=1 Tax=Pseudomonas sp. KNUC1026 TaxID=2893890 RepID=UPI0022A7DC29|nr:DUF2875 family protein [Pseudomonas sp. KNUC1026]